MKIKKLISCLLLTALICCTVLTGCSEKGSMFSDMKEISQITGAEFSAEGDVSIKSEDEDISFHFTVDGKTNGKDCAVNMSFTSGALTITLDDFIRMTNNTIYINQSSLFSALFFSDEIDGMKDWISAPVNAADDETQAMSRSFSNTLIDSLEKICRDQDISKNGDTWTMNVPADQMVSFANAALDEVDANISSWYDQYVELLEASGSGEILKEYSAFTGEETDDSEDMIQSLKDNKEDNLNTWKEMSTAFRDSLKELDESISKDETAASAKIEVSLTGKKGSRSAGEAFSFQCENSGEYGNVSMSISQNLTETDDITVDAPDAADVMTMDEYSKIMSDYYDSYDDYYDSYDDYYAGLDEEEEQAILSTLKDNQIYLCNNEYYIFDDGSTENNALTPYVITLDPKIYTIDQQIGNYTLDLEITDKDSAFASIIYESGNLEEDLKEYYIPEDSSLSTLTTDAGEILWYTETDEDYVYTYFGLQLDKDTYLLAMTAFEADDKLDDESCIKGMFKDIQPYTAVPDSL
ncbi:MAG: hypothetical protein ACI4D3_14595 [Lachnospiraceae bacterium]